MTPGGGNLKPIAKRRDGKTILGLKSILEQNNQQLKIMNERIQFLETGGRATSSYTGGNCVGDAAGKNYNNMTISTPLIDKHFNSNTQSNVNAANQNGYSAPNNGSSQLGPMVMVPQQLFYTPQGQPYYAHQPTPSPVNIMASSSANNWLAVNTPQGIMYQQQAIQNQGAANINEYNYPPNNMFDYALLDMLAYSKRRR